MTEEYLQKLGIAALNTMQTATLKAAEKHNEIILLSPTGSGKTLAYLLTLLPRLARDGKGTQALLIVPARELAQQIEQVIKQMSTGYKTNTFYGGHSLRTELNNLESPPSIAIGTPGRLLDLITKGSFETSSIRHLVLDEFDKSLEMGFGGEMSGILGRLGPLQSIFLTSATQAVKIPPFLKLAAPYTLDFTTGTQPEQSKLKVRLVVADDSDKLEVLVRLLAEVAGHKSIVFCNHRDAVDRISDHLAARGVRHSTYHGQHDQTERERVMVQFRNGSVHVVLATDLAARGLDIAEVENVVHYQLPQTAEAFIHRNGRTARMGASGSAYLLLSKSESPPKYLRQKPEKHQLPELSAPAPLPRWVTLEFSGGKKNKVNKVDIAGLLFKKAKLQKDDIGLIEVFDKVAYVAVDRQKAKNVIDRVNGERIKKHKLRVTALEPVQ